MAEFVDDGFVPDPQPPTIDWNAFVLTAVGGGGTWAVEEAHTESAASSAATRLRGRGRNPLVEPGFLDVRVEGAFVFARITGIVEETEEIAVVYPIMGNSIEGTVGPWEDDVS